MKDHFLLLLLPPKAPKKNPQIDVNGGILGAPGSTFLFSSQLLASSSFLQDDNKEDRFINGAGAFHTPLDKGIERRQRKTF